ncbi:MAG: TolC family protein, partial [Candidatus Poribacteria bacterium]
MRSLATPGALVLIGLLAGCATLPSQRYARLVENYEAAGAGAYHAAQVAPAPGTTAEDTADRSDWEAVRRLLAEQKESWSRALDADVVATPWFYAPDAVATAAYAALADNRDAADARLADAPSIDDIVALAVLWNPSIRAARQKTRAKLEQYSQVSALDDTLLQYNTFTKQLMTTVGKARHKEMMAMKYPFPDGLALKGRIVTEDVRVAERDIDIAIRDVVTAARIAYYDYLFVGEAVRINLEAQDLLNQMIYIAQAKLSVGLGKYHSVIMAQVELARLADRILTLEEQREFIVARVNTLLDRPADATLGRPTAQPDEDVATTLDELYAVGVNGAQELQ